jgi:hypothetical protein
VSPIFSVKAKSLPRREAPGRCSTLVVVDLALEQTWLDRLVSDEAKEFKKMIFGVNIYKHSFGSSLTTR